MPISARLSRYPVLILAFVALLGLLLLRFSTSWGSLWNRDSIGFIAFAQQIQTGQISVSPTHRPPLYAILLALVGNFGGVIQAGWWLNALVFAANILLIGFTVYLCTNKKLSFGVLAAALALAAPDLLELHATILSEPIFTFFALLFFLALVKYFQSSQVKWVVLAGIAVALATLQRYAALPLVGIGALGILSLSSGNLSRRIKNVVLFGVLSVLPIAALFVFNLSRTGNIADRTFALNSFALFDTLIHVGDSVSAWFGADRLPRVLRFLILGGVGVLIFVSLLLFIRKTSKTPERMVAKKYLYIQIGFIALYFVFLLVTRWFLDPALFIDDPRIISIVHYSLIGIICVLLSEIITPATLPKVLRFASVGVISVWVALMFVLSVQWATTRGIWATSTGNTNVYPYRKQWVASPALERAKQLPSEYVFMTFEAEIPLLLTGRPTTSFFSNNWTESPLKPEDYKNGMEKIKTLVNGRKVALIYFKEPFSFTFNRATLPPPSAEEVAKGFSLHLLSSEADGEIWISD